MNVIAKLQFPHWKSLLHLFAQKEIQAKRNFGSIREITDNIYHKMLICQELAKTNPPMIALEALQSSSGNYTNGFTIQNFQDMLPDAVSRMNTFFSIYDTQEKNFPYIDDSIEEKIGIPKEKFTMGALLGIDSSFPLHHPEDVDHLVRWASIAYTIVSLPGFSFSAIRDYYEVRFRLNVKNSTIPEIRQMEYVTMCKRSFLIYSNKHAPDDLKPRFHLNEYTILDEVYFDYVQPMFVSNPIQTQNLNALMYLINANLMSMPTKFIVILHYKLMYDRNKDIANAINEQLASVTNSSYTFDEFQISDCLTKSIKPKLLEVWSQWDRAAKKTSVSDQECVNIARRLGLIPIPKKVLHTLYENITEVEKIPSDKSKNTKASNSTAKS
jgi:hypothetical protein